MHHSRTESRKKFTELNHQAELEFKANPEKYKRKILFLGLLGYGIIALLFVLALGTLAGLVWLCTFGLAALIILVKTKLIFLIAPAAWLVLKSVWVKVSAPQGYELSRRDYPLLHEQVRQLSKELNTANIHRIIMVPELNAGIAQTPRLGIFGWQKNTLCLGLELLMTLSVEECKAVIAHEMGHLSASHSRFNNWVYRVRLIWHRIDSSLQQNDSIVTKPLRTFFAWYSLHFAGYSFALARFNEYEADAAAASVESKRALASALGLTEAMATAMEKQFWAQIWQQANTEEKAPSDIYEQLYAFILNYRQSLDERDLLANMNTKTSAEDTHPCLKDRLSALGFDSPIILKSDAEANAAKQFLGDNLSVLVEIYNKEWEQSVSDDWQAHHKYGKEIKAEASSIDISDISNIGLEEAHLWLNANSQFNQGELQLATLEQLQAKFPDDNALRLHLAKHLQNSNIEAAETLYVDMLDDFGCREVALGELIAISEGLQKTEALEQWRTQLEAHYDHCDKLDAKWSTIDKHDSVLAPEFDAQEVAFLQSALENQKNVKAFWIAKRELPQEITTAAYIVFIQTKGFMVNESKVVNALTETLGAKFAVFVIDKDFQHKSIIKRTKKLGMHFS
ncbi:M48 family metallopeptidase [Glaciecola sp. MH2013]|uniref:M48 family metallopeptidase n=1 Tax=Glaciecola sp. MH2013 TaxID=2785524 RepID=UPI00189C6984|nr:M48 family metallopeptidase [Glaciecola sp. MH2013]MBF7073425.1 M48 family metallopeptidase [Glaciecola sp. MH2013]